MVEMMSIEITPLKVLLYNHIENTFDRDLSIESTIV